MNISALEMPPGQAPCAHMPASPLGGFLRRSNVPDETVKALRVFTPTTLILGIECLIKPY